MSGDGLDVVEEIARRHLAPGAHMTSVLPPERVDVLGELRAAVEQLRRPELTVATADPDLAADARAMSFSYGRRVDVIVTNAVPPDRLIVIDHARLDAAFDRALTEQLGALFDRTRGRA